MHPDPVNISINSVVTMEQQALKNVKFQHSVLLRYLVVKTLIYTKIMIFFFQHQC